MRSSKLLEFERITTITQDVEGGGEKKGKKKIQINMTFSPPQSPTATRPVSTIIRPPRSTSRMSISSRPGGSRASDEDGKTAVKVGMWTCGPVTIHSLPSHTFFVFLSTTWTTDWETCLWTLLAPNPNIPYSISSGLTE